MSESTTLPTPATAERLPTHLELPDTDGVPMMNGQQPPQSSLLTECMTPRLHELRPNGDFLIGEDLGIYWEIVVEEPLRGARAPDWFCVLGVPPLLDGVVRRSYVLRNELVRPLLLIEYVSGDGEEERDHTPNTGKFWIYEQRIRAPFYAIFDCFEERLEVHYLANQAYVQMAPNGRGRYPIDPLGIELGLWHGRFRDLDTWWVRPWDITTGEMFPSHPEQTEAANRRTAAANRRAEAAEQQSVAAQEQIRLLLERLRAAGLEPPESPPDQG